MNTALKLFALIFAITSLSACIYIDGKSHDEKWQTNQTKNRILINELEINTTYSDTVKLLGTPEFSEAFVLDNNEYRVLYYRTQHKHADGKTSKDETTPLVFKNEQLVGWGQTVMESLDL